MEQEAKKYSMIETSDYLLNDILTELKEINRKLGGQPAKAVVAPKPVVKKETKPKKRAICKTCGKVHENAWEYGVCGRKTKKKEGV